MRLSVGVSEMRVSTCRDDVLVTHALGSCVGVAIHDGVAGIGALLHAQLPLSRFDPAKARDYPLMFVDTAVPQLFRSAYALGAQKERLKVWVAGGASANGNDRFEVGRRNLVVLKRLLWKNGVFIENEDTGGSSPRTMYMDVGSGHVWVTTSGVQRDL